MAEQGEIWPEENNSSLFGLQTNEAYKCVGKQLSPERGILSLDRTAEEDLEAKIVVSERRNSIMGL